MAILPCSHTGYLGFGACCKATQNRSRQQFNTARPGTLRLFLLPFLPSTELTWWEKWKTQHLNHIMLQLFPKGWCCLSYTVHPDGTCQKESSSGLSCSTWCFQGLLDALESYRYLSSASPWAASSHVQAVLCEQEGELGIQRCGECCENNHPNSTDSMRWFLQGCEKLIKNNNR